MKINWKFILFLLCAKSTLLFQAVAAVHTYPANAPCDSQLQVCIDAADDGDVIQLAAALIDEDITISKSLILIPAPGLPAPEFGTGIVEREFNIVDGGPGAPPINVLITQMRFTDTDFNIALDEGTGRHYVELNNSIINNELMGGVYILTTVEAYITIRNNTISSTFFSVEAETGLLAPTHAVINILANRINSTQPSAIAHGIGIFNGGSGLAYANIHSNVIHSVGAGIDIFSTDSSRSDVRMINNTLDDIQGGGTGINVAAPDMTSIMNLAIYNNIVTRATGFGIKLPPFSSRLSVSNGYNNFWANAIDVDWGGYSQGPDTIFTDPMYSDIDNQNYIPLNGSPCIETGTNDPDPVGLPPVDVQNFPRILGAAPDIGAHEFPIAAYSIDDFSDGELSPLWSYPKGNWVEDGSRLIGKSERKALALDYSHTGASICTIEAEMMADGDSSSGAFNRISLFGWYQDKDNHVQLLMNEEKNKWILKQRLNGVVVNKKKLVTIIQPFVSYRVRLTYDGSTFNFYIGDFPMLTMPVSGTPSGIEGFQVKGVGRFGDIYVY